MTTKPVLPEPPSFPLSNASYNSIVGKMHKAALAAATAKDAIAAVSLCRTSLKGTNTYAKASRRYADQLLVALGQPEAQANVVASLKPLNAAAKDLQAKTVAKLRDKPAIPMTVDTAAGPVEVDLAKVAVDPSHNPGVIPTGKAFSNKSNARRGLKSLGLDHLPLDFLPGPDGTVIPVVTVENDKGAAYAAERGIAYRVTA
jgi:hypothetical protein